MRVIDEADESKLKGSPMNTRRAESCAPGGNGGRGVRVGAGTQAGMACRPLGMVSSGVLPLTAPSWCLDLLAMCVCAPYSIRLEHTLRRVAFERASCGDSRDPLQKLGYAPPARRGAGGPAHLQLLYSRASPQLAPHWRREGAYRVDTPVDYGIRCVLECLRIFEENCVLRIFEYARSCELKCVLRIAYSVF